MLILFMNKVEAMVSKSLKLEGRLKGMQFKLGWVTMATPPLFGDLQFRELMMKFPSLKGWGVFVSHMARISMPS